MQTRLEAPAEEPLFVATGGEGVRLEDVRRSYRGRRGELCALAGLTLQVAPGEVVAVVGPSGCGKSTLLELVCGLQAPDAGICVADPAVLMPQRDLLLPWLGALDNAALALRLSGGSRREARRGASELFERAGLRDFERAHPHELSGGMRQRVAFVRTLLAAKPVLALDEPFGSLDTLTRERMQSWLAEMLLAEPRTVLLVTHDVEEALVLADRVALLSPRPGRVIFELAVDLPRPRIRTDPLLVALRARALEAL